MHFNVNLCWIIERGEDICRLMPFRRLRFDSLAGKTPWRRKWKPTPSLLPAECHGQRKLVDYGPWGLNESFTTEQLTC